MLSSTIISTLATLLTAATTTTAAAGGGMGSVSWAITDPPKEGVDQIEFSFKVNSPESDPGYYMAMQFPFVNREDIGYCGIQPNGDKQGSALFSIFGSGAEIVDSDNCNGGADGGDGVSCKVEMTNYDVNKQFYIQINRDENDKRIWAGAVTDKQGYTQKIGSWKLGAEVGGINGVGHLGFLEYFAAADTCGDLPYIDGIWYQPHTDNYNTTLDGPSEYGNCEGNANFNGDSDTDANGDVAVNMKAGFKK